MSVLETLRDKVKHIPKDQQVDLYFSLLNEINLLRQSKNYDQMLLKCLQSFYFIEALIEWDEKASGFTWNGKKGLKIPCIEIACPYLAAKGDYNNLIFIQNFINEMPKLKYYQFIIENALKMYELREKLLVLLKDKEVIHNYELKKLLNEDDGRIISLTIQYLEKLKIVKKIKEKRNYKILFYNVS